MTIHRHLHITSHIAGDPGLNAFLEAAHGLNGFEDITSIISYRYPAGYRVIGVAFYSKDLGDGQDWISTLPEVVEALTGLLEQDAVIVSAWDGLANTPDPPPVVWKIPGYRSIQREDHSSQEGHDPC